VDLSNTRCSERLMGSNFVGEGGGNEKDVCCVAMAPDFRRRKRKSGKVEGKRPCQKGAEQRRSKLLLMKMERRKKISCDLPTRGLSEKKVREAGLSSA